MSELGLFPLGLVLLPTERVPLHIFEPRYKELIGECLDEERDFGLLLADDDGLRQIGTRASVVEVVQRFDDGRLNIVVEGGERFRVLELTDGRSFQTGEVEPVEDDSDPPEPAEVEHALEAFRRLAEIAEADVDDPPEDSGWLSFELAARVDFGLELKQELLELLSERARVHRLAELMENAAQAIALEQQVRGRAAGNGKVSLP